MDILILHGGEGDDDPTQIPALPFMSELAELHADDPVPEDVPVPTRLNVAANTDTLEALAAAATTGHDALYTEAYTDKQGNLVAKGPELDEAAEGLLTLGLLAYEATNKGEAILLHDPESGESKQVILLTTQPDNL